MALIGDALHDELGVDNYAASSIAFVILPSFVSISMFVVSVVMCYR